MGSAVLAAGVAGVLAGCSGSPEVDAEARAFPYELEQAELLDVQVFRDVTRLRFTNTSGRPLGPGMLWVNRRFGYAMPEGVAIGERVDLDLKSFVDEFGDPFRAGGFFATRDPDKVVIVEYEEDAGADGLLAMVVVSDDIQ